MLNAPSFCTCLPWGECTDFAARAHAWCGRVSQTMKIPGYIVGLLQGGLGNLGAYPAAQLLLCLLLVLFVAVALSNRMTR